LPTHIILLLSILVVLLACSAFFSSSETAMMSINRYRLKHLAKSLPAAKRVQNLLKRPDRLLGVILLGNNFVNISASSIATIIAIELLGERIGVIVASISLTFVLLIFGEISPKTLAAFYPEKIAFPSSFVLTLLLKVLYPIVWVANAISNSLLRCLGASVQHTENLGISKEELRTIVNETTGRIPSKHRAMLLSILDLEKAKVNDIMIPRNEVVGIDLNHGFNAILGQLASTQHSFLPVYEDDLNNLLGVINAKTALHLISDPNFDKTLLRESLSPACYVPENSSLTQQLINFQKDKQRFAIVVDEYGDVLGIVTLEDILEEIVGDFTTDLSSAYTSILPQEDGSYLVEGITATRDFNRIAKWPLPIGESKTINGLIIDYLQDIPEVGTCCLINGIPVEIIQMQENRIKIAKIFPPLKDRKNIK